ncbi:MMPL family transporter [Streptomyces sp. cmx-4-9]|uniref:MMPL family transporter n=1 Tax=Streptomyces sp. cmx-4-9 TaxID=2790941 RepID=UPI003980F464
MSGLLGRLAGWSFRHARPVLGSAVLLVVLCAVAGLSAGDRWSNGGYTADDTAAERAESAAQRMGAGTADLVLYARPGRPVDAPAVAEQGKRLTELAARSPGVSSAVSYWSTGLAPLRSTDGRGALLRIDLAGDQSETARAARTLTPALRAEAPGFRLAVTGPAWVNVAATDQAERDLVRSELLALPVTLGVLVLAFGSLGATLVPVLVGGVAVAGALAVLSACTRVVPISVFAANLTFALGFGLAVDYGLFTLSRYREERAAGFDPETATVRAMSTAGRSVAFCALTMAWCMTALLVFPLGMVRSLALAAVVVVALGATATLVVLPALLAVAGDRLERLDPFRRLPWRRPPMEVLASALWRRIAVKVTGRPVLWTILGTALLAALALPTAGLRPALVDESILPPRAEARSAARAVRADFPYPPERQLIVVLSRTDPYTEQSALDSYARRLSLLPGAAQVSTPAGDYAEGQHVRTQQVEPASAPGTLAVVFATDPPQAARTAALVDAVRDTAAPGPTEVAGVAAQLADTRTAIFTALGRWAVLMLTGVFLGLLVFARSLLVAVKAVVLGGLSIAAALGVMVMLFQELAVLGPPAAGGDGALEITMPLLASALAFGLCVDYEVFLIARMKEEWGRTGDNSGSIVFGIEHTGRLFTTAAVVVAVSMGALVLSDVGLLVVLGATMAAVVVLDATVVRGVLVPAVMSLTGRANWWAPSLRRSPGSVSRDAGNHSTAA